MTHELAACEWVFGGRPLSAIASVLRECGYDALEAIGEPDRNDLSELSRALENAGLRVSGLTADTAGRAERDLANPDRELRARAVSYYRGCVDLAKHLGAPTVGVHPSGEGRLAPRTNYQREWHHAVAAVREIAHYAGEHGASLAIEPLNRYEAFLVNRVEQALAFVSDVDVPGVGIVADLFHMNIEESDIAAALHQASSHLREIHLADSNRRGLGHGQLPVSDVIGAAPTFEGPYVMEFTSSDDGDLDGYLRESAEVIRKLR